MSRLASRIAKLEAKRKANEAPKVIAVIGGPYSRMIEDPDRPGHLIWPQPPGGYAAFVLAQQTRLLAEVARLAAELEEPDEAPSSVGILPDQLAPGHRKPNFVFRREGGKEIQIDTRDGTRTVVG